MLDKEDMISIISKKSDRYGNLLIKMMDRFNVDSLRELTVEQVTEFYLEVVDK